MKMAHCDRSPYALSVMISQSYIFSAAKVNTYYQICKFLILKYDNQNTASNNRNNKL